MDLLNKMTIKSKLILSGILMVIFSFLFGLISIAQMNRLGELTNREQIPGYGCRRQPR